MTHPSSSQDRAQPAPTSRWTTLVLPVIVGLLVHGAVGNGLHRLASAVVFGAVGRPRELDQPLQVVLGFFLGLVAIGTALFGAWCGGRVSRRMAGTPAQLPSIARAYVRTLIVLSVLGAIIAAVGLRRAALIDQMQLGANIEVLRYMLAGAFVLAVVGSVLVARRAILGSAQASRRR